MDVLNIILQTSVLDVDEKKRLADKKLEKKKKYSSVYDLVSGLVGTMNKIIEANREAFGGVSKVICENQPQHKLPHMKNIAIALQAYYQTVRPDVEFLYVNPLQKFRHFGLSKQQVGCYKDRKKMAVDQTISALTRHNDTQAMVQLSLYKKKDDLCDSYLLALQEV